MKIKDKNGNGPLQEAIIMRNVAMVDLITLNHYGVNLLQQNLKENNALETLENSINERKQKGFSCLTEKNHTIRLRLKNAMMVYKNNG